jgi:hypothetical protein
MMSTQTEFLRAAIIAFFTSLSPTLPSQRRRPEVPLQQPVVFAAERPGAREGLEGVLDPPLLRLALAERRQRSYEERAGGLRRALKIRQENLELC